jgi:arginyl-tRNA synthetase
MMMLDELRHWLDAAINPWLEEQGIAQPPAYVLEEPPTGIAADVACNLPLLLAKPLQKAPRAIAQALQTILVAAKSEILDEITIAGAGFLNFRWSLARLQSEVRAIAQAGDAYGHCQQPQGQKVLIEFVSANPTGPLHVGHGRGAALGDSLALILKHLGYSVNREYYINDAGNQVELLAQSVLARCRELQGKKFELPAEGYHGDYIKEIATEYLKTHADPGDDTSSILSFSLRQMQKQIEQDLGDFGVHFDSWFSEASLVKNGLVEKYIQALAEKGYIEHHEDAVWFVAPGEKDAEKDKNRVLRRRDGRWTYFATDVAYHADKFARGYDRLIDVWGADHHGYMARVLGSMQALGYDPARLHIVLYQLVSLTRAGVPVSMSKRSGDFITLREVLNEVGKDACRFFFALRGPNTALDFDLELAKKQSADNPVFYLQYAHARICSIFRQASEAAQPKADSLDRLKEKEERDLMKRLAAFPYTLQVCAQEDSPHPLANYLLTLCRQFHYFYDHHRVLGEDIQLTHARLTLIGSVRQILRLGLALLGVSAPESM